jgi:AraC-like DNA-binding protein
MSEASPFEFGGLGKGFDVWQEFVQDHLGLSFEQQRIDDRPFKAKVEFSKVEDLCFTRITESGLITSVSKEGIRNRLNGETVLLRIQIRGITRSIIGDIDILQKPQELMVLGWRPGIHISTRNSEFIFLEIPKERLRAMLGNIGNYEEIKIDHTDPKLPIVLEFLCGVQRASLNLDDEASKYMARIGSDLISNCLISYANLKYPISYSGEVIIFRAKNYINNNLGKHLLDPTEVAAAVGVPLRQLQILFQERKESISDYIWNRRVEAVAKLLEDIKSSRISIGTLAYNCGFSSHAHFSRRFKDYYNLTPRDYRYDRMSARIGN